MRPCGNVHQLAPGFAFVFKLCHLHTVIDLQLGGLQLLLHLLQLLLLLR